MLMDCTQLAKRNHLLLSMFFLERYCYLCCHTYKILQRYNVTAVRCSLAFLTYSPIYLFLVTHAYFVSFAGEHSLRGRTACHCLHRDFQAIQCVALDE
uniref:Uncharacterized protein n=1 Tax=Arundo donax TaxID=35708 RepID=A0A0A9CQH7_ARUDO